MSNNSQGVFHWIRESVRRSVLLGFSDAVEQLGVPTGDVSDVSPHVMAVLKHTGAAPALTAAEPTPAATTGPAKTERKRLGRSLEPFRDPGTK